MLLSSLPGIPCWDQVLWQPGLFTNLNYKTALDKLVQLCTAYRAGMTTCLSWPKLAKTLVNSRLWKEISWMEHFKQRRELWSKTNQLINNSINASLMVWSQKTVPAEKITGKGHRKWLIKWLHQNKKFTCQNILNKFKRQIIK